MRTGHAWNDSGLCNLLCCERLGIHLDRLFKSAKLAKLKLPFGDSEETGTFKDVSRCAGVAHLLSIQKWAGCATGGEPIKNNRILD